jgi:hypothetical protein
MTCNEMEAEMLRLKDVPCMDCVAEGRDGIWPVCAMQFDHVPERGPKVGTVRSLIKFNNEKAFKKEIAKCDVVCANHHAIRTSKRGVSDESRKRMSVAQRTAQRDPATKAKKSEYIRRAMMRQTQRKELSARMKRRWKDPEFRRQNNESRKKTGSRNRLRKLIHSFDRKLWMEMVLNNRSQE